MKNRKKEIVHSRNHKKKPGTKKHISNGSKVILTRALSKLGYCSRTRAAELIRQGRVKVNQQTASSPDHWIDLTKDLIQVDGKQITAAKNVYLMLNKPRGLVTTVSDEKGRETIFSCLTDPDLPWIFPVGRLDKASEGLLLLTNDTDWAATILDPSVHLNKIYHVQIRGMINGELLNKFKEGIFEQGELLKMKQVKKIRQGSKNSWLEIILDEGRNRHIRRLLQAFHLPVIRLIRIAIGSLTLGDLKKGEYRHLTVHEQKVLQFLKGNL